VTDTATATATATASFALRVSPKKTRKYYRLNLTREVTGEALTKDVLQLLINLGIPCEFGLASDFLDINGNCQFGKLSTGEADKDLLSSVPIHRNPILTECLFHRNPIIKL
jgi:hypothetical protein